MDLEGLALWNFEALEVSKDAFGCCKYLFDFWFCLNVCLMQEYVT